MPAPKIQFDDRNANSGTVRGRGMLERSLQNYGAGRAPVADRNGKLIGGNKTAEVALELGLDVQLIPSDGKTLYVIQRTDLDLDDPTDLRARELAIADNRVGEVSLSWEPEILAALQEDGVNLEQSWFPEELEELLGEAWIRDGDDTPEPQENPYTKNIETPVYTPSQPEPPAEHDLYITSRRDRLVAAIQAATLMDEARAFLLAAAERHVVFDYGAIAEYYAHASPEVQALMEDSALVIIDAGRAIELGYAQLRSELTGMVDPMDTDEVEGGGGDE